MHLVFSLGDKNGTTVEFSRNWFWGNTKVTVNGEALNLASLLDPATHFDLCLTKEWRFPIYGQEVVIVKTRPLLFAGFRPQSYQVFVDGQLKVDRTGY